MARRARQPDLLAGRDALAEYDVRMFHHVAVPGDDAIRVHDVDEPATAANRRRTVPVAAPGIAIRADRVAADLDDAAGRGGVDDGAPRHDEIDALVGGPRRSAEPGPDFSF